MAQTIPFHMVNEVINCSKNELVPKVGMLGTYFVGSDRYACVIAKVISPKKVFVVNMLDNNMLKKHKIFDPDTKCEYVSENIAETFLQKETPTIETYADEDPEVAEACFKYDMKHFEESNTFTLRKNGRWIQEGKGMWDCGSIHFGIADEYRDPNF